MQHLSVEFEEVYEVLFMLYPILTTSILNRTPIHCYQWKWLNILGRALELEDRFFLYFIFTFIWLERNVS